jgi:hypothetical protein
MGFFGKKKDRAKPQAPDEAPARQEAPSVAPKSVGPPPQAETTSMSPEHAKPVRPGPHGQVDAVLAGSLATCR